MASALTIAGSDSGGGAGIQAGPEDVCRASASTARAPSPPSPRRTPCAVTGIHGSRRLRRRADRCRGRGHRDRRREDRHARPRRDRRRGRVSHRPLEAAAHRRRSRDGCQSGDVPLTEPAVEAIRRSLLPLAAVLTPNRPEAERLLGPSVSNRDERGTRRGGSSISARAPWSSRADTSTRPTSWICSTTARRSTSSAIRACRTRHTHGAGCTFAAAIAALLALGQTLPDAVQQAIECVEGAIAHGLAIGSGRGPVDHFWAVGPAE